MFWYQNTNPISLPNFTYLILTCYILITEPCLVYSEFFFQLAIDFIYREVYVMVILKRNQNQNHKLRLARAHTKSTSYTFKTLYSFRASDWPIGEDQCSCVKILSDRTNTAFLLLPHLKMNGRSLRGPKEFAKDWISICATFETNAIVNATPQKWRVITQKVS